MTAPALPRPDLAALQAAATAADDAYTRAIRDAAQQRNWYGVAPAAHAYKQARAAVTAAEQDRT